MDMLYTCAKKENDVLYLGNTTKRSYVDVKPYSNRAEQKGKNTSLVLKLNSACGLTEATIEYVFEFLASFG